MISASRCLRQASWTRFRSPEVVTAVASDDEGELYIGHPEGVLVSSDGGETTPMMRLVTDG